MVKSVGHRKYLASVLFFLLPCILGGALLYKFFMCVLFICLIGCGRKVEPVWPAVVSQDLASEVSRISPRLFWCDGQATGPRKNNIDGRPNCDLGDAMTDSGMLLLLGNIPGGQSLAAAIQKSITVTGQPFRTPSYVGRDVKNEFSRDQFMGLVDATAAGMNESYLNAVLAYYNRTGSLCEHPSDNRCTLYPSMITLADDARGRSVTLAERALDEATIATEARLAPLGYEAYLVSRKIFMRAVTKNLTKSYASSAENLYKRAPKNLWFRTLYGITNGGTQDDFNAIGRDLAKCMGAWQTPGSAWLGRTGNTACPVDSVGHDLVALATFLQQPPRCVK